MLANLLHRFWNSHGIKKKLYLFALVSALLFTACGNNLHDNEEMTPSYYSDADKNTIVIGSLGLSFETLQQIERFNSRNEQYQIILNELPDFFAGNHTAEETAAIIQKNVQEYLGR